MARFPLIETEDRVQVGDKIRISAAPSFVSNEGAITVIEIKPSKNDSFATVTTAKFLDWAYDFSFDLDSTNNKIHFQESGAVLIASVAAGNYTTTTLPAAVKAALDTAGTQTYTVSITSDKMTVSAASGFSLLASYGDMLSDLFFGSEDLTGKATYTSGLIESVSKEISVKITTGTGNTTTSKQITVLSALGDNLFSTDEDLKLHEPEVMKLLPASRASFKNMHRRAQELILNWLDKNGYVNFYGNKLLKADFINKEELRDWSTAIALRLVYEGVSNATDDIFHEKAVRYFEFEEKSRDRAVLRLDLNRDGKLDKFEQTEIRSTLVVRR